MNLAQISHLENSENGQALLAEMMAASPLLQQAEFSLEASTFLTSPDKGADDDAAYKRAEGDPLNRQNITGASTVLQLALYGKEYAIDDLRRADTYVGAAQETLKNQAYRTLKRLARALAQNLEKDMLIANPAATATSMLGLGYFIQNVAAHGSQVARLGYTTTEIHAMLTDFSIDLKDRNNAHLFNEMLTAEINAVPGANTLICNSVAAARLSTIARMFGMLDKRVNTFGTSINTFGPLDIIPVTTAAIPNTESFDIGEDSYTNGSSIFICRMEEDSGVNYATNGGLMFSDFDDDGTPEGVSRIQLFTNLKVGAIDAVRRLSNICFLSTPEDAFGVYA